MDQFKGKTAFVTRGAGGIGLALCHALGQRGMYVAIADVEATRADLRDHGAAYRCSWWRLLPIAGRFNAAT